jgi:hypothetical protein
MDILDHSYANLLPLLLLAAMLWLLWPARKLSRRRAGHENNRHRQALGRLQASRSYWGVTIRGKNCHAVRPYLGKKYAFDRAPSLPLAGCRSRRCRCQYQGLLERRRAERRSGVDRRETVRLDGRHPERRSGRDRRRSAIAWRDPSSRVGRLGIDVE